jgi:hypothetical protein
LCSASPRRQLTPDPTSRLINLWQRVLTLLPSAHMLLLRIFRES